VTAAGGVGQTQCCPARAIQPESPVCDGMNRQDVVSPGMGDHGPLVESFRLNEQNLSAMAAESAIFNDQGVVRRATPNSASIADYADGFQK
jgi:hypothetical protein